jgi:hypothetical protein
MGRLRAVVVGDRLSLRDARPRERLRALQTIAYAKPLRLWLRLRWRRNRRLRIAAFSSCVIFVLALALGQLVARRAGVEVRTRHVLSAHGTAPFDVLLARRTARFDVGQRPHALTAPVQASARLAPPLPSSGVESSAKAAPSAHALSARRRLQRADLWLRVQTPRGASEARQLLESTLAARPSGARGQAHGQAALAEACLRLDDADCARRAIEKAIHARPQRAKYRALEAKISDTFAPRGDE